MAAGQIEEMQVVPYHTVSLCCSRSRHVAVLHSIIIQTAAIHKAFDFHKAADDIAAQVPVLLGWCLQRPAAYGRKHGWVCVWLGRHTALHHPGTWQKGFALHPDLLETAGGTLLKEMVAVNL